MNKRKLKIQYKQSLRPMGIFQVKNLSNGKIFIDSGLNLQGKINGCKFQLALGSHINKELQKDFNKTGVANFSYKIVDILEPKEEIKNNDADDLKMLEKIWIEKLQPFGDKGYNKPKNSK